MFRHHNLHTIVISGQNILTRSLFLITEDVGLWQHCWVWSISLPSPLHHDRQKPLHQPEPATSQIYDVPWWIFFFFTKIWGRWKYLRVWWVHGGGKRQGWWGTYPLHVVFTKVVSPPWSVLVHREGLRGREAGFIPHLLRIPATTGGSRTV